MRTSPNTLLPFFQPRGVAVIGASADPGKLGHGIVENLVHPEHGFPGAVYPVNPHSQEILGRKCYPDILSVPDPLDLAVILIPAEHVPSALEDCGKRGLKAVIIISGGFREMGPEGEKRENLCREIAKRYAMRIIGPNGIGVIDTHTPLNTTFVPEMTGRGQIDFISQSGALCGGVIDWAQARRLDFSRFLSIGNKLDVDESDLLHFLAEDDHSKVIALYLEDVRDGQAFLEAARHACEHKFVLALKGGRTSSGQTATASHTGALAGGQSAFTAACRQTGIQELQTIGSMLNTLLALTTQPLPKGDRIAILTNAGGPSALTADLLDPTGLKLAHSSPATISKMKEYLSTEASLEAPVDMLGGANETQYRHALEDLLDDPSNDGVIVIHAPTRIQDPLKVVEALASVLKEKKPAKPVITCLFGQASFEKAFPAADAAGLPVVRFPEEAVETIKILRQRSRWLEVDHQPAGRLLGVNPLRAHQLLSEVSLGGRTSLESAEACELLEAYGIQTPKDLLASSADKAVEYAKVIGYPVALKLASPDILHKSDVGGVVLNLSDDESVRHAFETITTKARAAHPEAHIRGVQVQQMVKDGREVIVGMKRDPAFGPLLMFGLGGVYVEVLADVSFRLAPLSRLDAGEMISEVKSAHLLDGLRGAAPADRDALMDVLLRVGQLAADCPEIAEMDLNPLMVLPAGEGAVAADVRIILSGDPTRRT